jgi:hypothetical protein
LGLVQLGHGINPSVKGSNRRYQTSKGALWVFVRPGLVT